MGTLIVIVGLAGSGKTWTLNRLAAAFPEAPTMHDGFADHPDVRRTWDATVTSARAAILRALREGRVALVGSLECAVAGNRDRVMREVQEEAPGTTVLWLFFANEREKANRNCERDQNRQGTDPNGKPAFMNYIERNNEWSRVYDIPDEAIRLSTFELPAG